MPSHSLKKILKPLASLFIVIFSLSITCSHVFAHTHTNVPTKTKTMAIESPAHMHHQGGPEQPCCSPTQSTASELSIPKIISPQKTQSQFSSPIFLFVPVFERKNHANAPPKGFSKLREVYPTTFFEQLRSVQRQN
ncbi:hypothetical protein COW46_01300 [Candidatus Gracilibacteria bacterium CG17_big_fil_post_rev_8_21_14_2_50_48_13]|nr:MAG: hypothetical protein COW46_01300 [Candidatus Gracilibacteria bacterium CG17_big_fil_post_rev_8_21_14_2_50_48_13]